MSSKIPDIYGSMTFSKATMRERLPKETYKRLMKTIESGSKLDPDLANIVAHAMKEWSIEKGATHFSHWFQPLTGITSEKHDSFITPTDDGRAIMTFSGSELVQGEPDASSFPSGGLRATFEARGYTAWDPTSPAFIKDEVLCIPTAFASYNGDALDKKTPLLRSMSALSGQAVRVLHLFGKDYERVNATVGAEQEYFLIREEEYKDRPDLILTGRTLFGAEPAKGQELEEHYFGAIRPTVNNFMKELDTELWKLGIPAKTKHNEVAPAQHELAPIYEQANAAVDNNLLTMELMRLLASHSGLVCLQHEKPFEGINGSGKHDNWSISTPKGNLLDPGDTPEENLQFLVFLTAVIEAVDKYQGLLRASVATAGNDHRLGANEAPPAIISIFLGSELGSIVESIVSGEKYVSEGKQKMLLGVPTLPEFFKDTTDRNRTSPFAFTGNKFEFRMPGSQINLSDCNTVLNTAVAESLKNFADAMEGVEDFEASAMIFIKESLTKHQRIIFNGNGYSNEWPVEAEKRGLLNNHTTPEALSSLIAPENIALYEKFHVLSESESHARYEAYLEKYCKTINVESRTMYNMANQDYLPAILAFGTEIASNVETKEAVGVSAKADRKLLEKICEGADKVSECIDDLAACNKIGQHTDDSHERALHFAFEVLPRMEALRAAVDEMELLVSEEYWPYPTYNKILFYV